VYRVGPVPPGTGRTGPVRNGSGNPGLDASKSCADDDEHDENLSLGSRSWFGLVYMAEI
jgi:hypothetical protein